MVDARRSTMHLIEPEAPNMPNPRGFTEYLCQGYFTHPWLVFFREISKIRHNNLAERTVPVTPLHHLDHILSSYHPSEQTSILRTSR